MVNIFSKKINDFVTYIILVLGCLFAILPILWALSTSLKHETMVLSFIPRWIPSPLTLDNYYLVLFRSKIPTYLVNSLFVSISSIFFTLVISIPAGYAVARFRFPLRNTIMFYILMTSMIPGISILVPLYNLTIRLGLYNTFTVMIIIFTAWRIPISVWIIKGFFETVPREIEDAARVDGCGWLRLIYAIMIPIVKPGIAAAALLSFVDVWNDFLIPFTFTTKQELRLINVGLYQFLSQYGTVWGQLMAAVILALLPVVILFVLLERKFIQGLSMGAIKG